MSYTLRKSSQGIWIQGVPRAGRLAKSQGLLVVLGGTKTGMLRKSQEQTVNTLDQVAVRVLTMVHRNWPNGHLAEVSGKLFGTGIYDPININLVSIEKSVDGGGWTPVVTRPSDPSWVFPSQADGVGADYTLVVEPDEWTAEWSDVSIRFRVTVGFTGLGNIMGVGGPWTWDGYIHPGVPAWILVPASSASGNFTVSWADLDGASGYELSEGVGQPIVWGSYLDVGDVNSLMISSKGKGIYWYRVRAYNPVPNYGGERISSNPCNVESPPPPPPFILSIRRIRAASELIAPSLSAVMPSAMAEKLYDILPVAMASIEPDPRTFRNKHYYNSKTNRLYVRIETDSVPVWRPIGG